MSDDRRWTSVGRITSLPWVWGGVVGILVGALVAAVVGARGGTATALVLGGCIAGAVGVMRWRR